MPKRAEIFRNLLILAALVGLVLFSWLLGHILRYSIPALWHPPIPQSDPQVKYGLEFEGIRRLVVLKGAAPAKERLELTLPAIQLSLPGECVGTTYFTSLPAKCLAPDGRLIRVRGIESNVIVIPQGK